MCGRYTHKFKWKELHDLLARGKWPARLAQADEAALFAANFNVAPTQSAPVIRVATDAGGKVSGVEVVRLKWGLAPLWAKEPDRGPINARAETVASNAMFRQAFASRRCVVPVSGFYEWKKHEGDAKQPFYITRADDRPLLLAGLWERWGKDDQCVETFAVITTPANQFMSSVHDRMPAVLEPESVAMWLEPQSDPDKLTSLLAPAPDGVLQMHPVSTRVNSPRNTGEELTARAEPPPSNAGLWS
ncbi:MAG: SOS response-associated peptidase [Phycisphaerales bacterium]